MRALCVRCLRAGGASAEKSVYTREQRAAYNMAKALLLSSSLFTSSDDLLGLVINRILSRDMQEDVTRGTQGGQKDKFLNKRTLSMHISIHTHTLSAMAQPALSHMMSLKWKKPLSAPRGSAVYY